MEKRYREAVQGLATDEEVKGCRLFGQPIQEYTKEELEKAVASLAKQQRESSEQHTHDMNFLTKIHKAHITAIKR